MTPTTDFLALLEHLPGSYGGPTRPEAGPYALIGAGEGTLAAALLSTLIGTNFTKEGTQFVLSSPDAADAARTYAELAEVAGAKVRRIGTGGQAADVDVLVPAGALCTYHYAQAVAYATGHAEDAQAADRAMTALAALCAPHNDHNPARELAWSLWGRAPLLLAAPDAEALPHAWQALLARVGKTLGVPVPGDPLPVVTAAFEAQHEHGDGRLALILGDTDPTLNITREILESRIDEIIHIPYPQGTEAGYAGQLAHWYFAAWVAAYVAERYQQPPADVPVLARAQATLAGEDTDSLAPRADQAHERRSRADEDDWSDNETEETEEED